jgi:glycosyltransferase involved in cell wall biosynthesis
LNELLIFGPVPPLRAGIPKHTHSLAEALCEDWVTTVYSPKKLYFNWLYPGAIQDEIGKWDDLKSRRYILRWGSDGSLFLKILLGKKFDVALIPWWTTARVVQNLAVVLALKLRGTPFSYFCHNVLPHDANPLSRGITKNLLRLSDSHFVQGTSESELLKLLIPGSNPQQVAHPIWAKAESAPKTIVSNRFLFFGFIRPYKGIELLIQAIPLIDPNLSLEIMIAGEVWDKKLEARLVDLARRNPNVMLRLGFVPDDKLPGMFESSRAVLMPYLSATGSGVLNLAKQFSKPVIASDIPAFNTEVRVGIDGLVFAAESFVSLAKAIERFSRDPELGSNPWTQQKDTAYEWSSLAMEVSKVLASSVLKKAH